MVFIVGTPALAFSPGLDEAQQNTVVGGVVVDKNNEPLIGVSVMVEGLPAERSRIWMVSFPSACRRTKHH